MADVLACDDIDYVFGDVGGVVADAFEIFGDEDELEGGEDGAGISHHVGQKFAEDLVAEVVDLIVAARTFWARSDVAADDGVEGVADHFFGKLAHAREIHIGLDARVAEDAGGGLGDVDGLVADALEVVVDAGNGEDEAKIHGHQLMEGEELDNAIVDFDLQFVDGVFFIEDALGQLFVGFQDSVDGLMDGALGEAAHPERRSFNSFRSFSKWRSMNSFPQVCKLHADVPPRDAYEHQPKRPVM